MNNSRRVFLRGTIASSLVAVAAGSGLLVPGKVLAAAWPEAAFGAKNQKDALKALVGSASIVDSKQVRIKAPAIAENGAVVPITVSADFDNLESISLMALENAMPLVVSFKMTKGVNSSVSTRIKMGKTSDVVALARTTDGKVYSTKASVKVTLGGCGG